MVHKSYETQGMAIIMRNIALDSNIMTMEYSILIYKIYIYIYIYKISIGSNKPSRPAGDVDIA